MVPQMNTSDADIKKIIKEKGLLLILIIIMPPRVALVEGWTFTVCEASTLWNLSNCIASQAGAPEKPWSLVRAGLSPHSPWHWCRQPRAWCSESPLPVLCHRSSSLAAEPCSWSLVRHQVPAHRFCLFLQQVAVRAGGELPSTGTVWKPAALAAGQCFLPRWHSPLSLCDLTKARAGFTAGSLLL